MLDLAHEAFGPWESFYVIVGSAAAALTGLQFVVIVLISEVRASSSAAQIEAFGSPTVVHFCATLLIACVLSAPWHTLAGPRIVLAALGIYGVGYAIVIARRARRQKGYRLVLEDWIWHTMLPLVAYGAVAAAALLYMPDALFVIGAASVLFLFIGIHNAWDTVTYIATVPPEEDKTREHRPGPVGQKGRGGGKGRGREGVRRTVSS